VATVALSLAAIPQLVALCVISQHGFDSSNHLAWIEEWHKLWNAGIYYPRWLPEAYAGFGSPAHYVYPPLSYALSSILYLIFPNASSGDIIRILIGLTLLASSVTMWLYLRQHVSDWRIAIAGATLYAFAPYRFLDYSTRCALSEHISFVFIPLAFLAAERILRRDRLRSSSLLFVVGIALLLLTSLPSSATVLLGLMILVVFHRGRGTRSDRGSERIRSTTLIASLGTLAVGLAACYLWPAVALLPSMRLSTTGWQPGIFGSGSPIVGLFIGGSLTLDGINSLCFIGATILLIALWRKRKREGKTLGVYGWTLGFIVVLQLPYLPLFLFYHVPPFKVIEIPSRLGILLVFAVSARWAATLDGRQQDRVLSYVVAAWAVAITLIATTRIVIEAKHPHVAQAVTSMDYAPVWLRLGNDTLARSKQVQYPSSEVIQRGAADSVIAHSRTAYMDTILIRSVGWDTVSLHRAYWPAWTIMIDGKQARCWPDSIGHLATAVPAGDHVIIASLETTDSEKTGRLISLVSLLVLVLTMPLFKTKLSRPTGESVSQ
jgi:hypothetical protein